MKEWQFAIGEYFTHVYDKNYGEALTLLFDLEDMCLTVENVTLNLQGIVKLRKRLQDVERYLKNKEGEPHG